MPLIGLQMHKRYALLATLVAISVVIITLVIMACNINYKKPIIIWTNQAEFATYVELFNASQNTVKAVVVYKKNPVEAFPPSEDEQVPDIVIGKWLKNEKIRRNFMPIDYLFTDQHINKHIFYPQLLALGNIDNKQYLLPVSFNLPAVVFSNKNKDIIKTNYMIDPDQIRDTAALVNTLTGKNSYTKMGFAPRWTPEFLYQMMKTMGANFAESSDIFSWDQEAVNKTVTYLKNWTESCNTSTSAENDYKFKYLYTPELDWISSDRCLFAYTTSNKLFQVTPEKLKSFDYRWIDKDDKILIDDDIISMGMYKYSKNIPAAEHFIIWFMTEDNQKTMLKWKESLNLYTRTFGIADGFSSIQSVNERVYPIFYQGLFGNLPIAEKLKTPNILPAKWESIKEKVLIPYMESAINTEDNDKKVSIQSLLANWKKQFF
jgi:ABC-type glycerol-3-phosphate transport system substrate-binding protein